MHIFKFKKNLESESLAALPPTKLLLSQSVIWITSDGKTSKLIDLQGTTWHLDFRHTLMLRNILNGEYGISLEIRKFTNLILNKKIVVDQLSYECYLSKNLWNKILEGFINLIIFIARRFDIRLRIFIMLHFARLCFIIYGIDKTVLAWAKCAKKTIEIEDSTEQSHPSKISKFVLNLAAHTLPFVTCKERALVVFFECIRLGHNPNLIVGIRDYPLEGHFWTELDGVFLSDHGDRCERFIKIRSYSRNGIDLDEPTNQPRKI